MHDKWLITFKTFYTKTKTTLQLLEHSETTTKLSGTTLVDTRHFQVRGRGDLGKDLEEIFSDPRILRVSMLIPRRYWKAREYVKQFGFRREGKLRKAVEMDGKLEDLVLYGLTREDWEDAVSTGCDAGVGSVVGVGERSGTAKEV